MTSDLIAGKYRIVREIARSNDIVYEAVDAGSGRRLAIKELVIPPNLTGTARIERIDRFKREARATGKLSHPNIVTVYDYGEDNGRFYIAMEYLEGQTLRDVMQSRGALPVAEAVEISCQILSALAHAHSHKVIHRDVKPDNIHILSGGQIKLTDFGIARLTEEVSLTGEGQVFGTPSYMSPEQIEGKAIDYRTDIFSTGILLYEMVAGRKPFTGDSVVTITYNIMHGAPPPMAGIPYGIEQAILRALQKNPTLRFGSADEMRQALKTAGSVPALFFSPGTGQTGMGYNQAPTTYAPAYPPAYPAGVPLQSSYGVSVPPAYAPAQNAYPQPAPPMPQTAAPVSGGPFVNWGTGNPVPPGQMPPPAFARPPAGPLLSPAARSGLLALIWALVIGGGVLALVLLFERAYDQQKVESKDKEVMVQVQNGEALYKSGRQTGDMEKLRQAAEIFRQAMALAPDSAGARTARTDLATTLVQLGQHAAQLKSWDDAENCFEEVISLYQNMPALAGQDQTNLDNAKYNLAIIEQQRGIIDTNSSGDRSDNPDSNVAPDARKDMEQQAQELYKRGVEAFNNGDVTTARTYWQQAASLSGTQGAIDATKALGSTQRSLDY